MLQAGQRRWYVVYSKPRKEIYATTQLRLRGLEVFFPKLCLPQSAQARRPVIPLFPNYLFVKIRLSGEYNDVVWCPGVKRFLSFGGDLAHVDDTIVEFLMQQANDDGVIMGRSTLKIGQEVQICGGSLNGLIGIIQEPPDARGRVRVLMKLLSREIKVDVPVHFLKSSWAI